MHHFGGHTAVLGALRVPQSVVDDGAVAMLHVSPTPPALAHGPLIAPSRADPRLPRLCPAQFVQALVVDAEMMADLVNDRDGHLVDHVILGVTDVEKRLAVDRDGVG